MERWKKIKGWDNYSVSNFGRVKSLYRKVMCKNGTIKPIKERLLSISDNSNGYKFIGLRSDGKTFYVYVHQLVLKEFGPQKPSMNHEVNHKDGNKNNNHIDNLEWVTSSENKKHAYNTGLRKKPNLHGHKNPMSKLSDKDVIAIRELFNSGKKNRAEIGRMFSVSWTQIDYIVKGKSWSCVVEGL